MLFTVPPILEVLKAFYFVR